MTSACCYSSYCGHDQMFQGQPGSSTDFCMRSRTHRHVAAWTWHTKGAALMATNTKSSFTYNAGLCSRPFRCALKQARLLSRYLKSLWQVFCNSLIPCFPLLGRICLSTGCWGCLVHCLLDGCCQNRHQVCLLVQLEALRQDIPVEVDGQHWNA